MRRLSERFGRSTAAGPTPVLQPSARVVRVALRETPRVCAARVARALLHTVAVARALAPPLAPTELRIDELDAVYVAHDDAALRAAIEAAVARTKGERAGCTVVADVAAPSRDDPARALVFEQWRFDIVLADSSGGAEWDREAARARFVAAMDELARALADTARLPAVRAGGAEGDGDGDAPWMLVFSAAPLPGDMVPPAPAAPPSPVAVRGGDDAPGETPSGTAQNEQTTRPRRPSFLHFLGF